MKYVLSFVLLAVLCPLGLAQRQVFFPPAEAPPPPPAKKPPKTIAGAEDTDIIPDPGPVMRRNQIRNPPPPTNLAVIHKIKYGGELTYVHADGTKQKFEQWKSFPNDTFNLMKLVNESLADGNNYTCGEDKPLASTEFNPIDIPILYMTGDYDFVLQPAEIENLRKFITQGGTVIFNSARGRDEFSRAVAREMRKVFPQKGFMRVPPDHPIFNSRYRIEGRIPMVFHGQPKSLPAEIYSIDIGTRAAAILVPAGLGAALSGTNDYHVDGKHVKGDTANRLAVNLVAYMLGSTEYGRFLAQDFPIHSIKTRTGDVVRFAAVRYAGSWDLNPALQNSLLASVKENTGIDVDMRPENVTLDSPEIGHYPLLFMTGHYDFQLSQAEAAGLAKYLKRGGMLFASAGAGLKPFDTAFRREILKAVPGAKLMEIPKGHEIFKNGWNPLSTVNYTEPAKRDHPTLDTPKLLGLFIDNRLAVVYSSFDVMSGVNREANTYAKGVVDTDALRLAINVVTYALSH